MQPVVHLSVETEVVHGLLFLESPWLHFSVVKEIAPTTVIVCHTYALQYVMLQVSARTQEVLDAGALLLMKP